MGNPGSQWIYDGLLKAQLSKARPRRGKYGTINDFLLSESWPKLQLRFCHLFIPQLLSILVSCRIKMEVEKSRAAVSRLFPCLDSKK